MLPRVVHTNTPPQLPTELKFTSLMILGSDRTAVINGVAFAEGDQKPIRLREKTVMVRCQEIGSGDVTLRIDDGNALRKLKKGRVQVRIRRVDFFAVGL